MARADADDGAGSGSLWLAFSLQAEKVFVLAHRESRRRSHFYVGTAHLLFGLLGNARFAAAQTLQYLGVNFERLEDELQRVMEEDPEVPERSLEDIQADARSWENFAAGHPDPDWDEERQAQHRLLSAHRGLVSQVFNERSLGRRGYAADQVLGEAQIALYEAFNSGIGRSSDEEFSRYATALMRQRIDERLKLS
ncbi:MAG: Clp protease N-terminal domain-containing protein [Acidimicrobiales bacterium]